MIEIYSSGEDLLTLEQQAALNLTLEVLFEIEGIKGPGEISLSFLDQDEIRDLNRDYRGIDEITDVLSFPQESSKEELMKQPYKVLGDIVINLDRVKSQAQELGHSFKRELLYLTIHSFYHLLGYDHEEADEKKLMRIKEEEAYRLVEERL